MIYWTFAWWTPDGQNSPTVVIVLFKFASMQIDCCASSRFVVKCYKSCSLRLKKYYKINRISVIIVSSAADSIHIYTGLHIPQHDYMSYASVICLRFLYKISVDIFLFQWLRVIPFIATIAYCQIHPWITPSETPISWRIIIIRNCTATLPTSKCVNDSKFPIAFSNYDILI